MCGKSSPTNKRQTTARQPPTTDCQLPLADHLGIENTNDRNRCVYIYIYIIYIEDAYGGSSPHSFKVCVCDYSRSRGRHKCRQPRKPKPAYLQNMHICKTCISAKPAYLQTEAGTNAGNLESQIILSAKQADMQKHDRKSSKNSRNFMILEGLGASGADLGKKLEKVAKI